MTFIPHLHTDLREARLKRRGATHDAKDVPTGLHKEYARMEKIMLPQPAAIAMPFGEILEKRKSYVTGNDNGEIPLHTWGTLMGLAIKKRVGSTRRNYPSGGALYTIETYVITSAFPQSAPAAFHYNPTDHALEKLWNLTSDLDMTKLVYNPDGLFSTIIIFTSVWQRSSAKYGNFTYILALLEAGHMSENILLASTALGLSTRPMAGFDDDSVIKLLDLDAANEQPVHSIVLSS